MSENTQKPITQNAEQAANNSNKGKRHNRHHRGGKKHHRPHNNPENQDTNLQNQAEEAQKAPQKPQQQKKQKDQQQGQQKQQNQKQDDGNAKSHDRKRNRGRNNRNRESRLYDPYEAPNKEEIALSELRAQIVLQSADGSVPTVYGATTAPTPEKEIAIDEDTVKALLDADPTAEVKDESAQKVEVVGIRFRSAGKTYYFDPGIIKAKKGDFAVVETTRGPEFGEVYLGNAMVSETDVVSPLRPVIRLATDADIAKNAENREKEKQAIVTFQEKVQQHKLEMKAIDVQYAFDGSKILFYFSSEGRVDFRELVKDLASVFRTRIELRQIGIRDEAKMLGGIGVCGRALCCSTFLPDFAQVSIKMAKDQNLSLNSAKISGVCGRLMCCLRYEADVYAAENKRTPGHDATVRTPDGIGTVISSNPLAGTIRVILKEDPDSPPKQYHRDDVTVLPKEKKNPEEAQKKAEK